MSRGFKNLGQWHMLDGDGCSCARDLIAWSLLPRCNDLVECDNVSKPCRTMSNHVELETVDAT